MEQLTAVFVLFAIIAVYFLPALVAYNRSHRSAHAILAVNLLMGWLLFGWLWALIWSLTGNVREGVVD